MTLGQFTLKAERQIREARLECAEPRQHAERLVEEALRLTAVERVLACEHELHSREEQRLENWLARRLSGEPLQYICGEEGFWDAQFRVGKGVLIPRPETELVVEKLLEFEPRARVKIGELGAGSGNIGIAVLRERPDWQWHAFEANPDSWSYAEQNRVSLLPGHAQYALHRGDFFSLASRYAPFDWIVTNPPYVPSNEWETLSPEVRSEPRMALDGGASGLSVIERILDSAPQLLRCGGRVLLEIEASQSDPLLELLQKKGYLEGRVFKDYAGRPRVGTGRWGGG